MEAIILAGGFGTRLKHIVSDVPKPMAPINNKPFLMHILDYLKKYNCTKVIMAVGYKSISIKEYFGNSYSGIEIVYSDEDNPLGTGGAIKKALMNTDEEEIFILNGDTFFNCNLNEMRIIHESSSCDITIAVKRMNDYSRYGSVVIKKNRIIKFVEKQKTNEGLINAGIYLIDKKFFEKIEEIKFSFEQIILESHLYSMCAYESNGYFIDIGVPEDYYKAQKDFANERAIFLDRDGTINKEVNYLYRKDDFEFISNATKAINLFHKSGYKVIVITNQAGVARGFYREIDVEILHSYIDYLLDREGAFIDAYYYCPHHPEGTVVEYSYICSCRKPEIGMIEKALKDYNIDLPNSIFIGDNEIDIETGKRAGVGKCFLVRSGHFIDEKNTKADAIFNDIYEIATVLSQTK